MTTLFIYTSDFVLWKEVTCATPEHALWYQEWASDQKLIVVTKT